MSPDKKSGTWFDPFGLNPQMAELGEASGEMMEAWMKAWQGVMSERAIPAMGFFNPVAWAQGDGKAIAKSLEGWLGTPEWSDMLSLDSETLKRFAPAAELAQLSREYLAATARLSLAICQKYQARIAKAGTLDGSGEALDIWNAVLDESLMEFNRSETFADLQRRFLRALMAYKQEQRWFAGRMAEQFDLPTRAEVDEIARRVHAVERENRRLRRALAERPTGAADE